MVVIKKFEGDYYVCKVRKVYKGNKIIQDKYKSQFNVRATSGNVGAFKLGKQHIVSTPPELVGKKLRLKVVIIK